MKKWMHSLAEFRQAINATVLIAGLGYFVDLFDIALFGVVRTTSLKAIGVVDSAEILAQGIRLYNAQMLGMMVGGVLWGLWADRRGRTQVMFGSILLYSVGNIANAFVSDVDTYLLCRFVTGIGLAGELGAAVTIVAESLPKERRGLGTTIVATLGLCGSVTAALVGKFLDWQVAYALGGVMGLLLLFTRMKVAESKMFMNLQPAKVKTGLRTFLKRNSLVKYLACVGIGMPIYFITGILFTFSPELAKAIGVQGEVSAGDAILYGSIGLALGDFLSGFLSQVLKSRRQGIFCSLILGATIMLVYVNLGEYLTPSLLYVLCFILGLSAGYWAILVTVAAEQFGTDVRGTVATSVPNFVRGSAVIVTTLFAYLKTIMSVQSAVLWVGCSWFLIAAFAVYSMEETFSKDLDYTE